MKDEKSSVLLTAFQGTSFVKYSEEVKREIEAFLEIE